MTLPINRNILAGAAGVLCLWLVLEIPYFGELLQESSEESLLVIAGICLGTILVKRSWRVSLLSFCCGAFALQCYRILPWRFRSNPPLTLAAEPPLLRFGSFNVLNSNAPTAESLKWMERMDVTVLLEFSPAWDTMTKHYKGPRRPSTGYLGIAILSRQGCVSEEIGLIKITSVPGEKYAPWARCTLQFNGELLDVFALHPPAPVGVQHIKERAAYLHDVQTRIDQSVHKKIVAGDFNSAPWTNLMQQFVAETGLLSAYHFFPSASTYPVQPYGPFIFGIPLDHILFSPDLIITKLQRIGDAFGSDHYGIEANFHDSSLTKAACLPSR